MKANRYTIRENYSLEQNFNLKYNFFDERCSGSLLVYFKPSLETPHK